MPVRIRDRVFGNLYLTEKVGTATSPSRTRTSSSRWRPRPGVAIENARLYEEAARRERWLAATAEITGSVDGPPGDDALQAVADRAREVAGADVAWIVTGQDVDHLELRVVSGAAISRSCAAAVHWTESLAGQVVSHRRRRSRSRT